MPAHAPKPGVTRFTPFSTPSSPAGADAWRDRVRSRRGDTYRVQGRAEPDHDASRPDPHLGAPPPNPRRRLRHEGLRRRGGAVRGDRLPRRSRHRRRRDRGHRPDRRSAASSSDRGHPGHRPLAHRVAVRDRGSPHLADRGVDRRLGDLAAHRRDQGPRRAGHRQRLRDRQPAASARREARP